MKMEGNTSVLGLQHYDALTGGYNRNGFTSKAAELIANRNKNNYVLINCDICYFKIINSRFGYDTGDRVIKHFMSCILRMQGEDETFGRINADNVCILWKYNDISEIGGRFAQLAEMAADMPEIKKSGYLIELAAGAYIIENKSAELNMIIDRAGNARESTKRLVGSGLTFYTKELDRSTVRKLLVMQYIVDAIRKEEIEIYFQPQFQFFTGTIVGAEALARWKSKELGNVMPAEFISVLEQSGKILELDMYVWEQVCKFICEWRRELPEVTIPPISVNVSRVDIRKNDLCSVFVNLLKKYNLPTSAVKLEITESSYMDNPDQMIKEVKKFQNAGFMVEMDDFGKGYSSLNTLNNIPVDALKLDMEFISQTEDTQRSGNILVSIVRMARWLDLPMIAEGVETYTQAEFLRKIGCDFMQGYLFAKPMPAEKFKEYIKKSKVEDMSVAADDETFKIHEFLDPKSKSSRLFKCIGPAAIIEYFNDNVEILMVNDSLLRILQISHEGYKKWMTHLQDHIPEKGRVAFLETVRKAISGKDIACEVNISTLVNGVDLWLKLSVRRLSSAENRHILLLLLEDTSEHYIVSPRVLSADTFNMLYNTRDYRHGIEGAIAYIGEQLALKRIYIHSPQVFEWCAAGMKRCCDSGGLYRTKNNPGEMYRISDVGDYPEDIKAAFNKRGIKSVFLYPFTCMDNCKCFVEFESDKAATAWTELNIDAVVRVSQILETFIEREENKK